MMKRSWITARCALLALASGACAETRNAAITRIVDVEQARIAASYFLIRCYRFADGSVVSLACSQKQPYALQHYAAIAVNVSRPRLAGERQLPAGPTVVPQGVSTSATRRTADGRYDVFVLTGNYLEADETLRLPTAEALLARIITTYEMRAAR